MPDGVGIKNYLYSSLIKHISRNAKITIWSPLPIEAFDEVSDLHNIEISYKKLELQTESKLTRLFREAATYARLKYNASKTDNNTILNNWRKPRNSFKLRLLYRLAEFIGRFASRDYNKILKLERKSKQNWSNEIIDNYKKELTVLKTDVLFITHQRVASIMPICLAAKVLQICSFTAIYSWDNPPKARMGVSTDYYLLWSDWMKNDMQLFYPEIASEQLKVVGTPQFEFYLHKNRIVSRKSFAEQYGLDESCKWICFSGDDEYTSPHDPDYLHDVAEAISKMNKSIQLIFRRCPVDFSTRYDNVIEKFNELIISIDPIWHTDSEAWVGYFSKLEDVDLQVNLAYHCDGVINLGSTMALDFATLNKPCLYLNYDTVNDKNWSTETIYKFHHFKSMANIDAVGWINAKAEIAEKINFLLLNKDKVGKDREKWLKTLVEHPLDYNALTIANILK